jgi:predicted nucleic acid-binding protein
MIDYLLDAGPLIGLLDGTDQWHRWSAQALTNLNGPLATTETALAEVCHRLRRLRPALQETLLMVAEGRVAVYPILSSQPQRTAELLEKYPRMDAGDATLVVLSEQFPRAKLLTVDRRDFAIYRRADGRPVPTIMP